jgi:cobalt-zinc-cadmium efflux system outer membrane protein
MFVRLRAATAAMARQQAAMRSAMRCVPEAASRAALTSLRVAAWPARIRTSRFPSMRGMSIVCIGLALMCGPGRTATAEGLTLRQVIATALSGNKDLQVARFATTQARARLVQAGVLPNPHLELANKNDALFRNEGEYTASIGFSQQFPVAGRIARQKDVARVDIDLALAEIKEAEWKLAGEVANSFYGVVVLGRQVEARNRLIEFDQKLVDVARRRFVAAEVSQVDVNMAQLDLERVRQERALLLSDKATQTDHLNVLLGRTAGQALVLDEALPSAETFPALPELQRHALERRPDLRSAVLKAERAHADTKLALSQRWEDWTVGVGVERSRSVIEGAPPQPSTNSLALSLSIPLPLADNKQGRIEETLASGTQANAQIAALRHSIGSEVASNLAEVKRLQQAMVDYQRTLIPMSERNLDLVQQSYGQGQLTITEVVQAARQQSDLNVSYLNTLNLYLQALAKLRTATADYLK